jgi:TolB protein
MVGVAPRTWRALALLALASGCTETGPLSSDERAALSGVIFYVTGGAEHGDATQVKRLRLADAQVTPITDGQAPAFIYGESPTDARLALTIADDLFIGQADGTGLTRVASSEELDWYPRFSPDGRAVVFESARASFRDLYRLELATGEVVRLTDNPEGNFDAAWSPDGRKLAFSSSRAGQLDLWVMDADGANPTRLTFHPGDSVKPAWSPSGEYIAFISARDGKDDLFVVRPDGRDIRKLSPDAGTGKKRWEAPHVQRFAWHPTQDRVIYAAQPPRGPSHLFVVDVAAGRTTPLSKPDQDDREPAWSPDGEHLAFASVRDGASDIYIMRADGTRRTRMTRESTRAWLPRWTRGAETKTKEPK